MKHWVKMLLEHGTKVLERVLERKLWDMVRHGEYWWNEIWIYAQEMDDWCNIHSMAAAKDV